VNERGTPTLCVRWPQIRRDRENTKRNLQTQPGGWLSCPKKNLAAPPPPPPPPSPSLWSITHRLLGLPTYGGLCGMPACGHTGTKAVRVRGCGVCDTPELCGVAPRACVRVYARMLVPPNLYFYIRTYTQVHSHSKNYG